MQSLEFSRAGLQWQLQAAVVAAAVAVAAAVVE